MLFGRSGGARLKGSCGNTELPLVQLADEASTQ
jgi:hypothetical protein